MKKMKTYKWHILGLASLLFLLYAFLVRSDKYYLELPGGAYDIAEVVRVNKQTDDADGSYNFVAVSMGPSTLAERIWAKFTPFVDVSLQEEATGGQSTEDFWRISQFYMQTSQNEAIHQALQLADKEVSIAYKGVYVLDVADDSTFKGILQLADTVTGINGQTFSSSQELIDRVSSMDLGDEVTVHYTSDGQEKTADGKIIKLSNGKNGIGIGLVDHTEVSTDVPIDFSIDGVGGPSAGLMFTLAIYDQLVEEDLRQGRIIAGTGTIEADGTVGLVGGVDKKVVSAQAIGAEIFFVSSEELTEEELEADPDAKSNYQVALEAVKKLKTEMKIVPVATVQEAIDYLKNN